jgi:hypothetical protein
METTRQQKIRARQDPDERRTGIGDLLQITQEIKKDTQIGRNR